MNCVQKSRFPGVEIQCIGHFPLLFQLVGAEGYTAVQHGALDVLASVTRTAECVNDIAGSDVLTPLLLILVSVPSAQQQALDTLRSLMTTTKIVKDALTKGKPTCSSRHELPASKESILLLSFRESFVSDFCRF